MIKKDNSMKKRYTLGIDVGTTGTKTYLFSEDGVAVAHAYQGYALSNTQVGYSEQSADDWWTAIVKTVREVCDGRVAPDDVAAISLSTQGGTLVPVDKDCKPLRPAIVWNDARATEERDAYLQQVGDADSMYQKTGWALSAGLLLLEICWLRNHEPELFAKTDYFLSVPDFVSMKMTGVAAVDLSNAGINQTTNVRHEAYDEELLRFAGVPEEKLPKLVHSGEVIGHLTEQAAKELGLTTNAVLVAGAHDQYAVALGAGAIRAGDLLIGSGTCWVVTSIGKEPDFSCGLSQSVSAVEGLWGSLLSLSSGGLCLEWLRNNIATCGDGTIDFRTLDAEAEKIGAAKDGLFFFPFSGTYGDQKFFNKATFTGIDLSHNRFHLARAIMEGVAFSVTWMTESFKTKPSKDGITLAGGASKSKLWSQIVADITGLPVKTPALADLACVGAAILAGIGCGMYENAEEGYHRFAVKETTVYPNPEAHSMYAPMLEEYKKQAKSLGQMYRP